MNQSFRQKIGILAGEASGDLLGAKLIQALHQRNPNLQIEGIGGPAMIAAGCQSLFDIERLSVMGLVEPLLRLPDLIQLRRSLYRHFIDEKPALFIGIDSPDFNLGLEFKLKQAGIPIIHYVSPSVWAWRRNRVRKISKAVDLMLTLLPFEKSFYEAHHIPARYVGHPLADLIPLNPNTIEARRSLCIDEHETYIALLPGSRKQEIRYLAEPLLLAAQKIWEARPQVRFLTSHVNEERYQEFYEYYKLYTPNLPLDFFTLRSHDVIAAADVAVVTSGTATLETLLYKKPMVITYRMSNFAYQVAKRLVKVPYIGLPNLLSNQLLVPELIQDEASPEGIAGKVLFYLDNPEKVQILKNAYMNIHKTLQMDSSSHIAEIIFNMMKNK